MLRCMRFLWPLVAIPVLLAVTRAGTAVEQPADGHDEIIAHANESWTGDLDGMTKRGFLRILTVHNPLLFQFDGAEQRGLVAEWARHSRNILPRKSGACARPPWC